MPQKPPFPGRPAQPPGPTFLKYSPDGNRLLVAGCGNYARSFRTGDNGEPDMLSETHPDTLAIACGNDYAILGCEDGTVCQYTVPEGNLDKMLVRSTLPIRDIAISPNEKWVAVCSDELEIKVVNRHDMEEIFILRDHPKPIKHLSYDPTGKYLTASCTNGIIYVYWMQADRPSLYKTFEEVIQRLETADVATSKCVWHPDGKTFACAVRTRDVQVIAIEGEAFQKVFTKGHDANITSISWSANGALLASSDTEGQLVIWDTETQEKLLSFDYPKDVLNISWHNGGKNLFNWTTALGEVFIIPGFLKEAQHIQLLEGDPVGSPFHRFPVQKTKALTTRDGPRTNGHAGHRATTPDSLDELLGPEPEDQYDWIEDDDGAGYVNENNKRTNGHLPQPNGYNYKRSRPSDWSPVIHQPFQPGAAPWRGKRRYMCLNLIGFVWTVDQDTHYTVTVEFYDREAYRDFHFTDPFLYDKACLNEHGVLFSGPARDGEPATIFYRPHETWTNRADWRIKLPDGEEVTCLALSSRYVVAATSENYVRVWTLFGAPVRIWRLKNSPAVTCAAHGDFVMTIVNGSTRADGQTQLLYSIDNVRTDESFQTEDAVALGAAVPGDEREAVTLKSLLWSDAGDPCIYDSNGVLMVLSHWRTMGQAKWVPLLDTRQLERLKDGKKEETYWPVAVANEKFHCIILKGGIESPYFPRPLLSEFEFHLPTGRPIEEQDDEQEESNAVAGSRLEESFVRRSVLFGLLDDHVQMYGDRAGHAQKSELIRKELELDKILLQLLAVECREGEDRGMKALEIVGLLRDKGGKMVEAAGKIASRWGLTVLEQKIREMGERRFMGLDED